MKKTICILLLCLLMLTASGAVASDDPFRRYTDDYFGTVSVLCLYGAEDAEEIWDEVKGILEEIDRSVSLSRPDSDMARFNALPRGGVLAVSDCTAAIWRCAMDAFVLTGGLYDPTVYPLVDLWGFSPRFNQTRYSPVMPYDRPLVNGRPSLPGDGDVASLLALVGMEGITLSEEEGQWILQKNTPSVFIDGKEIPAQADLGGIAKGYACDLVAAHLRERGITAGHFICGGSSMAFLARPDGSAFSVSAGKPRPGKGDADEYAVFSAANTTLSTSSDAGHSYTGEDGILYCHIIDPRTGYPLNHPEKGAVQAGAASVSLLADSAALGDALTTALCLMGPEEALSFLTGREEKMVMAVYQSGADHLEVVSNFDADELTLRDEGYIPAAERDENGLLRYTGSFAGTDQIKTD